MMDQFDVAIVDYGLGNLFSVRNACETMGLTAIITPEKEIIRSAQIVVLPGVGAFGDAMASLVSSGLDKVLIEIVAEGKMLFCICLGMQLLMTESQELGRHKGLNIIEGEVVRLNKAAADGSLIKVPHVGWSGVYDQTSVGKEYPQHWKGTPLDGIKNNEPMYFVHSYFVNPRDQKVILSKTTYGDQEFCSALAYKNIFACQYHPEKSAMSGLKIYHHLARQIRREINL